MAIRVLVVDDSGFFRRRVKEILESDPMLEVVGLAENGEQAIEAVKNLKPDVVTMDIEMPIMDGITATRKIMQSTPTSIIMFSSLTTDGAKSTLDALDAGAVDFLPKRFEDISKDKEEAKKLLCQRVKALGYGSPSLRNNSSTSSTVNRTSATDIKSEKTGTPVRAASPILKAKENLSAKINLVAIGTSTGGPVALQKVLVDLPADFPVPVVVIQHMPGSFTGAFSERLDQQCKIHVKEAESGDKLKAGFAYIAPGGKQMIVEKVAGQLTLRIVDEIPNQTYKPSVDVTYASINKVVPKNTLAVILTGMGADGCKGAMLLHQSGSIVWAQDENSCVVYGMPAAVVDAGITEKIMDISKVGVSIAKRV
ncbi:Chemotaxis response regulator protein-glutamate methylesterase CheB [hydrothermal vent metagenome]|uniref:protein-glutamate methylesterase n=1 Tax=hydrothermal vent metagenome TaxID=652676 RepID=A0A3B0ZJ35_9ZZZZ